MWWDILNIVLGLRDKIHVNKVLVDRLEDSVIITIVVDNDREAETLHESLMKIIERYGDVIVRGRDT